MKILQVSHGFPPKEYAGVELYTFHLSEALARLNQQVSVFCRDGDPGKSEFSSVEEETNGFRVTRVVNNLTKGSGPRSLYDNPFFDQIFSKVLKKERPDIIHFQHLFGLSSHLVWMAKEEGYPVVMTLHDFFVLCHRIQLLKEDLDLCRGPLYGLECASCLDSSSPCRDRRTEFFLRMKNKLPFSVVKWTKRFFIPSQYLDDKGYEVFHRYRHMYEMLKLCDLILTPSGFVRDFFLKYYSFIKPKTRVLAPGIPPVKGNRRSKPSDGRTRFCYFGNILPIKGIHVLIEAFKRLPRGRALLTILGARTPWTAEYYDRLKNEGAGFSIDFRGPYQREDLPEILGDQEVAVLPSICYESFSFVIREAYSMGLPVIASKIGAIPEIVLEGVNGLLFAPGDVEGLRRCMLRFIEEPGLAQQMASGLPRVKSMEEHSVEMLDIYREVIGQRR
jgi:glycosyltransferase involved in cell wall biosynthesis